MALKQVPQTGNLNFFPNFDSLDPHYKSHIRLNETRLTVDRVPNPEFGNDRYYLRSDSWQLRFELSRTEADRAIELIGSEREPAAIWSAIEQAIGGAA